MANMLTQLLLVTFCLELLAFVGTYFFRSHWRENLVGRFVLYFMAAVTGVFVYIFFAQFIGDYPWKSVINILVLLVLNFVTLRITWLLIKIQQNGKDRSGKI